MHGTGRNLEILSIVHNPANPVQLPAADGEVAAGAMSAAVAGVIPGTPSQGGWKRRSRRLLPTTNRLDTLMAAAASMGSRSQPVRG